MKLSHAVKAVDADETKRRIEGLPKKALRNLAKNAPWEKPTRSAAAADATGDALLLTSSLTNGWRQEMVASVLRVEKWLCRYAGVWTRPKLHLPHFTTHAST